MGVGFSTKLRSCGITTEGTERTAVLDTRNHCSPILASAGGGGKVRQSAGKVSSSTDSMAISSLISTGIATRNKACTRVVVGGAPIAFDKGFVATAHRR